MELEKAQSPRSYWILEAWPLGVGLNPDLAVDPASAWGKFPSLSVPQFLPDSSLMVVVVGF